MERDDYPQKLERTFVPLIVSRAEQRVYGKGEFAAKPISRANGANGIASFGLDYARNSCINI